MKFSKLLAGILAVALVFSMQMVAFADESSVPESEASSATEQSSAAEAESSAAEAQATSQTSGEIAPPSDQILGSGADDENPDTGIDDGMLKISGVLLVLAVAGIVITTRRSKRFQG